MRIVVFFSLALVVPSAAQAQIPTPSMNQSMRTLDLSIGETQTVTMADGKTVTVRLANLQETRDSLRNAVREAKATVVVDGKAVTLVSANYRLPVRVGEVLVDCPVTKGYRANA